MTYSVAIRTLGLSGETLRRELASLHAQTLQPDKIVVYIAEGYKRPCFTVGREEYVEVPKGMVSQRALRYDEIPSEYILLLDDDVLLAPDSAYRMLSQMADVDADCLAADTFANHRMSLKGKLRAAVTGFVFPRLDQRWAFKLHPNGSFSYINRIKKDVYPSQSAAGPAAMWRKKALLALRFEDERWLDRLGFAYGDDDLEFYKLHINGGRLFVSFNCGIENLDGKSSSATFQKDAKKLYVRSMSNYIRWYRMHFEPCRSNGKKALVLTAFGIKTLWLGLIHTAITVGTLDLSPLRLFVNGIKDGMAYTNSSEYTNIPPYKDENIVLH